MKKKMRLGEITLEQIAEIIKKCNSSADCRKCILHSVGCEEFREIVHENLCYVDLDQEIEVEE